MVDENDETKGDEGSSDDESDDKPMTAKERAAAKKQAAADAKAKAAAEKKAALEKELKSLTTYKVWDHGELQISGRVFKPGQRLDIGVEESECAKLVEQGVLIAE